MILIRYLLICIIGYLIIRLFVKFGNEGKASVDKDYSDKKKTSTKKVSKKIGEYIDYEEIKK